MAPSSYVQSFNQIVSPPPSKTGSRAQGGLLWAYLPMAGEQACWDGGEEGLRGRDFLGLVILRRMSRGCGLRTAGSHLPSF